ncbi:fibronectin type III domain-containing protein [Candidatus Kaiserbacteria bacterium]|nr:fibronectin type III domain-containing protein [Candidatus Kaiserbacteria bacterium]
MKSSNRLSFGNFFLLGFLVTALLILAAIGGGSPLVARAEAGGPTVTLSSTTSSPTSESAIPVSALFSESVTGLSTSSIVATNGTISDLSGSSTVFTFVLNPIADGTTTVMIPSDVASSTSASSTGNQASNTLEFLFMPSGTSSTSTMPMISNVAATSTGTTSEMITWATDVPASSWVLYGTTTTYGLATPFEAGPVTDHMADVTGLQDSTLYHFVVSSGNAMGTTTSPDFTFMTGSTSVATSTASTTPLAVTGVDTITSVAVADNTFASGWKWVLHLTVPDTENAFRMKFGDFLASGSTSTIGIANNLRIFSPQSSTMVDEGSSMTEVDNNYGAWMYLTGDSSTSIPGRQINVTVEMRIPAGTASGTYTTSFGAQSIPSAATSTTP